MVLYKKLVPFVVDDIPPEHKFPGLGPPGPDVKCFKQIYVPGLAVVGNLSNTDKRRWGQGSIVPAHSVLDLKGKEQLSLFALVFSEWCFSFAQGNISKVTAGLCLCTFAQTNVFPTG